MNKKLDKKLLKKLAQEKIREGIPKQQVYDELVKDFFYRDDVAGIVKNIPSNERWKKYGKWNTVYLVLLCLMMMPMVIDINWSILWMVWLIYVVVEKKIKWYFWNSILGVFSVISLTIVFIYGSITLGAFIMMIVMSIPFIAAGVYLPKLLTPPFKQVKQYYINSEGKKKIRVVHKFEE